ncbi:uncharacterized protein LOC111706940 isoform X3 [Eurytemora carolleeae]|uniref:uncharacterized protein LOC111706940 isoform X3 n=1 Tax=Eurytemora carolleeae TaxID=1294199 RepID=UPI000C775DCB|nr:uncharacterized protein LOC111706940 isoform X3 [Eurytemora carolleeae]|eukprot:XP_023335663.1 uncharacterized protein LOC111706940 isoform X3 [Eurytemora affinis]
MRDDTSTETSLPMILASTRSSKLEPYQVSSSRLKSSESQSQPSSSHSKPAKSCLVECSSIKFLNVQTPKVFLSTESLVVNKKNILLQLGCYDPIRNKYLQIPIKEDGLRENAKKLDLTERKKNPTGNLDVGTDEISLEDLKSDIEPQAKKKPTEKLKIPDWKELIHNRFILPVKDDWMPVQIVSLENSGIMYSVLVPKGKMKGVVLGHSNVFRWMNVEPAAGFAYISSTATLDSFKDVMDDVLAKNILNLSGDVSFCSFVGSNDVYTGVQSVTEFMRLQIELVACLHRIPGCNAMITLAEYPYPPESEDIKHVHIFRCNEGVCALNKAYESPQFKTGTLFLGLEKLENQKQHLCSFKANIQPYNIYLNCWDWRNGGVSWKNDKFLKLNNMLKFWLSSTSKGSKRKKHDGVVVLSTSITDTRGKSLKVSLKNWGGSVGNFPEFVFNPLLDVSPILDYKCKFSTWMERNPLTLELPEPRLCKSVFGEEAFVDEEGNYLEMFTLNEGMNKLVEFLEQSAVSSALPYLVMYSSAEYITLALKCSKVNLSKRMKEITSGIIVFEKNLESLEFRNSLKQQHYGAEVKVKKKMSANLAAELCTWMNYTMKATNCMLHISNLSLSRHETMMFIDNNAKFLCSALHQGILKQIPEKVKNNENPKHVQSKSYEIMQSEYSNYLQSKKLKREMEKKKKKQRRRNVKRTERRSQEEHKFRKAQRKLLNNVQNKRPTDMESDTQKDKQIKCFKNVQRENNEIPVIIQSESSRNLQSLKLADIRKSSNPNLELLGANRRQHSPYEIMKSIYIEVQIQIWSRLGQIGDSKALMKS